MGISSIKYNRLLNLNYYPNRKLLFFLTPYFVWNYLCGLATWQMSYLVFPHYFIYINHLLSILSAEKYEPPNYKTNHYSGRSYVWIYIFSLSFLKSLLYNFLNSFIPKKLYCSSSKLELLSLVHTIAANRC